MLLCVATESAGNRAFRRKGPGSSSAVRLKIRNEGKYGRMPRQTSLQTSTGPAEQYSRRHKVADSQLNLLSTYEGAPSASRGVAAYKLKRYFVSYDGCRLFVLFFLLSPIMHALPSPA
jgi:hypothetical protein